jgi:hypothetical protein
MFGVQVRFIAVLGGALALFLVAVALMLRAHHRRRVTNRAGGEDEYRYDDSATIWAGYGGTTIVVRQHGRPRSAHPRPTLTALGGGASLPVTPPWEPPESW